ncbi:MAG: DMT family transporter [Thalassobaculales bacterium]
MSSDAVPPSLRRRLALLAAAVPPLAMAALGIALLTGMDGVVKALSARHDTWQLAFLRFVASSLIVAVLYLAMRQPAPDRATLGGHLVRGIFTAATATCFFYGLATLPITDVFVIGYLAPLLVVVLSAPLLGERPSGRALAGVALGFAGILATVGGLDAAAFRAHLEDARRLSGAAAVLLAALLYALVVILLRRQARRGDPPLVIVLFQSVIPAGLLALPGLAHWQPVAVADIGLFAAAGALGVAGHLALASAFARGEANRLVVVEYSGFIWAAAIGLAAFGEVPAAGTWAGAVLVVAACLLARR